MYYIIIVSLSLRLLDWYTVPKKKTIQFCIIIIYLIFRYTYHINRCKYNMILGVQKIPLILLNPEFKIIIIFKQNISYSYFMTPKHEIEANIDFHLERSFICERILFDQQRNRTR